MREYLRKQWVLLQDDPVAIRLLDLGVLIVAGLLSFVVFARVPVHALTPDFQGEFKNHALLLTSLESQGSAPYSIWYTLQQILVGGNRDESVLLNSGWLLLGFLAAFKGIVLTGTLFATRASRLQALFVGFLLGTAIAFPIPFLERSSRLVDGPVHYLGTLPPNVFMSSTQLLANVGAVAAVVTMSLWFRSPTSARFALMVLMALVATVCKPGIAPALLATIGLLSILSVRAQRQAPRPALLRLFGVSVVVGIPLVIAYWGFMSGHGWLGLHSEIHPFNTWTTFTSQWFPDLLASWAFPIVVVIVLFATRQATPVRYEWLVPGWSVAILATLMFALFSEVNGDGVVIYAGNFAWGAMAATSGLYVVSAIALQDVAWKTRLVPFAVLAVQAMAGLLYINNYVRTGRYL
jgi:hypothetical protein